MKPPRFSIAIPAFNAEKWIIRALESVRAQTFTRYEVVLTDDGSTDRTPEMVKLWSRTHPQVRLRHVRQPNRGIGNARNACIELASAEYVAFLDADDEWLPDKLRKVATTLSLNGADVVCHDQWALGTDGTRRRYRCGPHTSYRAMLLYGNCLFTSATVVRRRPLDEVGGFSENLAFNGVEDYELWLRLARVGASFTFLHEPLGVYRVHGRGITSAVESHCQNTMNVLDAHWENWPEPSLREKYLMRRNRASMLRWAGNQLRLSGHVDAARAHLTEAVRENPLDWKAVLLLIWASISRAVASRHPAEPR